MVARRKKYLALGLLPRMDVIVGKRVSTYYYRNWQNQRITLGHVLSDAKRKALDLEAGRVVADTVDALIHRYLREVSPKLAPRTHIDNIGNCRRISAVFGKMAPRALKPSDVGTYLDQHPAPVRANREIALLSSCYALAIRRGIADVNPCKGVRRNKETPRVRLVMDWELADLIIKS